MLSFNTSLARKLTKIEAKLGIVKHTDLITNDGIAYWVSSLARPPVENKQLYSIIELAELVQQGWNIDFSYYYKPFRLEDEYYSTDSSAAHHYFVPKLIDRLKAFVPLVNSTSATQVINQINDGLLDKEVAAAQEYLHWPCLYREEQLLTEKELLKKWLDNEIYNCLPKEQFFLPVRLGDENLVARGDRGSLCQLHYTFGYSINFCGVGFLGLARRAYLFAFIQYVDNLLNGNNDHTVINPVIPRKVDHNYYQEDFSPTEVSCRLTKALEVAEKQFCQSVSYG